MALSPKSKEIIREHLLSTMKKFKSPGQYHLRVLKEFVGIVPESLSLNFVKSRRNGVMPEVCRRINFVPINKKKDGEYS